jgi:hypothetical protein
MGTKIGFLRDEFLRIGCVEPKDPFEPRLYVGWHYTKIKVIGLNEKTFDYDMLCAVLREIPDGAGEEYFWQQVHQTNFDALADRLNREPLSVVN